MEKDVVERFESYLKNVKENDTLAVGYHVFCTDGVCSALITVKSLERLLKRKITLTKGFLPFDADSILNWVKENKINKLILVDLGIHVDVSFMKELEKITETLVLDHHEFKKDWQSEKIAFVHATLLNKEVQSNQYPASKMAFDLFSKKVNIEDLDWIAAIGLVSDSSYTAWKEFVEVVIKKYHLEQNEDVFKSKLGFIAKHVGALWMFKEKEDAEKTFKILYNVKSYKDILKNNELADAKKIFDDEMAYWIDSRDKAEVFEKELILYHVKSKFDLSSPLSTVLSFKFFIGKTVLVIADTGKDTLKISARNQVGVRVNDLLGKAIEGIPDAVAGGHPQASSTTFKREYLETFKENLKREYKKLNLNKD